jgi:hypothetical protein
VPGKREAGPGELSLEMAKSACFFRARTRWLPLDLCATVLYSSCSWALLPWAAARRDDSHSA